MIIARKWYIAIGLIFRNKILIIQKILTQLNTYKPGVFYIKISDKNAIFLSLILKEKRFNAFGFETRGSQSLDHSP